MKLLKFVRNVLLLAAYLLTGITLILTNGSHVLEAASLSHSQMQFLSSFCEQNAIRDEISPGWVEVSVEDTLVKEVVSPAVSKKVSAKADKVSAKKKKVSHKKKSEIKLSKNEKKVLLRIVEAEASGEDQKGKMLVANVVLNRVKDKQFPDNVTDVVFQHENGVYQFSPILDGRYYEVTVSEDTRKAVNKVLEGADESEGALYFISRSKASAKNVRWFDSELTYLFGHGTHQFYK